jgi:ABC-type multidrug transport system ATPase subunit
MDVSVSNLTRRFGKVDALRGIDLTIPQGMYALLGPNGAGKTTLMRILAGIIRPSSGEIQIGPYDCMTDEGRTGMKRILGYLPQELGLYPDLTAREFLDYVGILKGIDNKQIRRNRVNELLEAVALTDAADRKVGGFSGGMKRRIGIAQAILNQPRFLIVDEPTAGLDPEERIRFRNLLAEIAGECTVLLSTHIVEDVAQTCRNLAVLVDGRILFEGTTRQLIEAAEGRVWMIETDGPKPAGDATIISTLQLRDGVQYRLVSESSPIPGAEPTQPSLEDAYVWLLQTRRVERATVAV